eukprot:3460134-Amphidinium_carterae.1
MEKVVHDRATTFLEASDLHCENDSCVTTSTNPRKLLIREERAQTSNVQEWVRTTPSLSAG